jgi:hypothetical protein
VTVWTGFIWLRFRSSGGLLWIRWWTFWLYKRRGISWPAEWLPVSQGLCFMELIVVICCFLLIISFWSNYLNSSSNKHWGTPRLILLFCFEIIFLKIIKCVLSYSAGLLQGETRLISQYPEHDIHALCT